MTLADIAVSLVVVVILAFAGSLALIWWLDE
jgi:hypothetical protein